MRTKRAASGPDAEGLIGVDEARERVLAAVAPLPLSSLPLLDALGMTLGEPVFAPRDVPPFTNSAMDGFACRASDLLGASWETPVRLRIAETVQAGDDPGARVPPGGAIRIMTGAPLPIDADVVVAFERAVVDDGYVAIRSAYPAGSNVRRAGEDVCAGDAVLTSGARVRPAEIALLAAIGQTHVRVHRRPRVAILATGDEVVPPGVTPGSGQIWDSNSDAIAAMVRQAGGVPVPLGIARDVDAEIRARLASDPDVDLIVTSGGVSAGDFDLITEILQRDAQIAFWQIRIKPGRPLAFGSFAGIPLLGLPGNPVAAAVTFLQFARPAILRMLGRRDLALPSVMATMLDAVDNSGGRRHFLRVQLTRTPSGYEARLAGAQGSAVLSTLAAADGLLVVPETIRVVEPGTVLPVELPDGELPAT